MLPTQKRILELLRYEDGKLFWKKSRLGCAAGQTGQHQNSGYLQMQLDKQKLLVHRVVWMMFKGEWPKHSIDHINGDKKDNRIENLRDVTHKENCSNRKEQRTGLNKHGFPVGVCKYKNKWRLTIDRKHIGYYETKEEAIKAKELK